MQGFETADQGHTGTGGWVIARRSTISLIPFAAVVSYRRDI
jgi:hypothetical protein